MSNPRIRCRATTVAARAPGRALDFSGALADNTNGKRTTVLTYSQSDTPQDLRRDSVFSGAVQEAPHAC